MSRTGQASGWTEEQLNSWIDEHRAWIEAPVRPGEHFLARHLVRRLAQPAEEVPEHPAVAPGVRWERRCFSPRKAYGTRSYPSVESV
jgi:hypothetical protein